MGALLCVLYGFSGSFFCKFLSHILYLVTKLQGPQEARTMAGIQAQAPPSSSCCGPFAIFLIIITSPGEKAGNMKRGGTESVNFVTLETTEAGKKPVKLMVVFSRLELSYQEESRWLWNPPDWRLPYSFIVHDRLVRMWKNILDR